MRCRPFHWRIPFERKGFFKESEDNSQAPFSARAQDRMNQVFAVPAFPLAQRLAAALATVSVAVLWAPALPASPLLALAGELSSHCMLPHSSDFGMAC